MAEPTKQSGVRCYRCGSANTVKHGFSKITKVKKQRFVCRDCGRGFRENPVFISRMTERKGGWERKNLPSAQRLILELREIAQDVLGRTPGVKDIKELSKRKRSYSLNTYLDVFGGSFREAIRQAGLEPASPHRPDPAKMLEQLRALRAELNRPISKSDVVAAWKDAKAPSIYFLRREFGSVTAALEAAGVAAKAYSRDEIIAFLRKLDATLDGPVTIWDIHELFRAGDGPSSKAIQRTFGTLENACKAAGIEEIETGGVERGKPRVKTEVKWKATAKSMRAANRKRPSEGDLILKLCALAQSLGRTPTAYDVSQQSKIGRGASVSVYQAVFGKWSTALERARLKSRIEPEIDESTLIRELQALRKKLNRPVLTTDIIKAAKKGRMSPVDQFKRAFGTLKNALFVAGVGKSFNREEIIKYLRKLDSTLDRPILPSDITSLYRAGKGPSLKVIYNAFGGLKKARRAAGTKKVYLTKRKGWSHGPKYTPEELISQLKRLAKQLGRKPKRNDINAACTLGTCASAATIAKTFGNLEEAYRAAGFPDPAKTRRRYTDEEIIAAIEKLSKELGRMPKYGEFEAASRKGICPDPGTIANRLGPLTGLKSRLDKSSELQL